MEERQKNLYVSKTLKEKRKEDLERITSEYGKQLRMNRSIQAEGSFADVKADMAFRRYDLKDKRCVFIIDECHRSQFGKMHASIEQHLEDWRL